MGVRWRRLSLGDVLVEQLVSANLRSLPLEGERAELREPHAARAARRALADEDLAGIGALLESRRDVHGIAGHEPFAGAGLDAGDDLSRVDADAHRQPERVGLLEGPVQVLEAAAHPQRGAERARRIVLVRRRDTEDGHDRVADVLLDRPALGFDLAPHRTEERVHDLPQPLRVELLTQRGRTGEVCEEDRHAFALFADGRRHRHAVAARRAEVDPGRELGAAAFARRERRAAADAEPRGVGVLGSARRAGGHAASLGRGR
jgi:hypothetical protein